MANESDISAIRNIVFLYTHAIDRQRWDILDHVFFEDATFQFGAVEGDWQSFLEQVKSILTPLPSTHHQLGNVLINVEDNVAHVESYLTATHIIPANYPKGLAFRNTGKRYLLTVGGRYIDRFEKRGGEWRIAKRRGVSDWRQSTDINDGGLSESPANWLGSTDDSDPSTPVTKPWRKQ